MRDLSLQFIEKMSGIIRRYLQNPEYRFRFAAMVRHWRKMDERQLARLRDRNIVNVVIEEDYDQEAEIQDDGVAVGELIGPAHKLDVKFRPLTDFNRKLVLWHGIESTNVSLDYKGFGLIEACKRANIIPFAQKPAQELEIAIHSPGDTENLGSSDASPRDHHRPATATTRTQTHSGDAISDDEYVLASDEYPTSMPVWPSGSRSGNGQGPSTKPGIHVSDIPDKNAEKHENLNAPQPTIVAGSMSAVARRFRHWIPRYNAVWCLLMLLLIFLLLRAMFSDRSPVPAEPEKPEMGKICPNWSLEDGMLDMGYTDLCHVAVRRLREGVQ